MTSIPPPDVIAKLSLDQFNNLPKRGKPTQNQWTVLSCILSHNITTNSTKVVSLGTGTKCVGQTELCPQGRILNDSHAEVMARRAFLRYIYEKLIAGDELFSFNKTSKRFQLKQGVRFHFFSTHPPCGDATITSKSLEKDESESPAVKKQKLDSDVFTGAKLIGSNLPDAMDQEVGQIRTKPGRGIRTLSMSCSDKLSRWNILGIQGALLDLVLEEPLYIDSFTFCNPVEVDAVERAIYKRWHDRTFTHKKYRPQTPAVQICNPNILFEHAQNNEKDPSPASIAWSNLDERPLEVAVCGKNQGVTKKNLQTRNAALQISKIALMEKFMNVMKLYAELKESLQLEDLETKSLKELKETSRTYQEAWAILKRSYFGKWTRKPDNLLNFKLITRASHAVWASFGVSGKEAEFGSKNALLF